MITILQAENISMEQVLARSAPLNDVREKVESILQDVRDNGDEALKKYNALFDNARPETLEVTKDQWEQALQLADPKLMDIMQEAADNIRQFHEKQRREGFEIQKPDGTVVGQRVHAVKRAGCTPPAAQQPITPAC